LFLFLPANVEFNEEWDRRLPAGRSL